MAKSKAPIARIYIAGRPAHRDAARSLASMLRVAGCSIASLWHDHPGIEMADPARYAVFQRKSDGYLILSADAIVWCGSVDDSPGDQWESSWELPHSRIGERKSGVPARMFDAGTSGELWMDAVDEVAAWASSIVSNAGAMK